METKNTTIPSEECNYDILPLNSAKQYVDLLESKLASFSTTISI